jgi:Domain of unknown function (DUF4350)
MTAADPLLSERWHRGRRVVFVAGLVLVASIVLGVIASQERRGYLDPQGVDPSGARAVVRLLEAQGIRVDEVRTADEAASATSADETMLVTIPDLIRPENVQRLVDTGADLVLVGPADASAFADGITAAGSATPEELDPRCDLPAAERAGSARLGGVGYDARSAAERCYPEDDMAFLVVASTETGAQIVVLGTGDPLTNQYLDEDGNASLALGLLGRHPRLVWFRPTIEPGPAGQQATFGELLPDWVEPVVWQLGIAAVFAAWWRARRLGPVVAEPLPVVVRAAEATEGRARLYRRGRARGHAAGVLRHAVVSRLRSRLGLPRDAGPPAVTRAVSDRMGQPIGQVDAILAGPPPPDDSALVELAYDLDRLEQEVRSP